MAVTCKYDLLLNVEETALTTGVVGNAQTQLHYISTNGTLTNGTTPVVSQVWSATRSLTAGSDTLDLTALARGSYANLDLTGLKVKLLKIAISSSNSAAIVFADHATTGYLLFGDASGQVTLAAGAEAFFYFKDNLAAVSSTVKQIAITSADTDATYSMIIVAGA